MFLFRWVNLRSFCNSNNCTGCSVTDGTPVDATTMEMVATSKVEDVVLPNIPMVNTISVNYAPLPETVTSISTDMIRQVNNKLHQINRLSSSQSPLSSTSLH